MSIKPRGISLQIDNALIGGVAAETGHVKQVGPAFEKSLLDSREGRNRRGLAPLYGDMWMPIHGELDSLWRSKVLMRISELTAFRGVIRASFEEQTARKIGERCPESRSWLASVEVLSEHANSPKFSV